MATAVLLLLVGIWMEELALIGIWPAALVGVSCLVGTALILNTYVQNQEASVRTANALVALRRVTRTGDRVRPHAVRLVR